MGPYEAPLPDGAEVWGCSRSFRHQDNLSRLYNMDPLNHLTWLWPDYYDQLNARGSLVAYHQKEVEEVPGSRVYPAEAILRFFGFWSEGVRLEEQRGYFSSTPIWMFAHALYEGVKKVTLWRFLESEHCGDYFTQKTCFDYWLGVARGMGVEVEVSPGSLVGEPHPWEPALYGYVHSTTMRQVNRAFKHTLQTVFRAPNTFCVSEEFHAADDDEHVLIWRGKPYLPEFRYAKARNEMEI